MLRYIRLADAENDLGDERRRPAGLVGLTAPLANQSAASAEPAIFTEAHSLRRFVDHRAAPLEGGSAAIQLYRVIPRWIYME